MPQPTEQDFQAAAKKVMSSAPAGLSQEQFFDLIDKELNPPASGFRMMSDAAAEGGKPQPDGPPGEPDTYWGGFLGSIKKDLGGVPDALEHAAHPSSVGDFLSLILPSQLEEARPAVSNMGAAAMDAAGAVKGVKAKMGAALSGAHDYAFPGADDATMASQGFNRLPLAKQMDHLPATSVERPSAAMSPAARGMGNPTNDLPLHAQQSLMGRATEPTVPLSGGRSVPPTQGPGNPANDLPLYLQQMIMEDAGKAPSVPMTGGRASAVRPSDLGQETINKTLDEALSGKPKAVSQTMTGAPPEFHSLEPTEDSILSGQPLSPDRIAKFTPEDWLTLRNHYGARDAAALTGKTADEVRTLSGGGPSRTPQLAIDRILAAQQRARTQQ